MEKTIRSKISGVTMSKDAGELRQSNVSRLDPGKKLWPLYETTNPFDANAVKLFADESHFYPLGYVSRELAKEIALDRAAGWTYEFEVLTVTGGEQGRSFGCNILLKATKPNQQE